MQFTSAFIVAASIIATVHAAVIPMPSHPALQKRSADMIAAPLTENLIQRRSAHFESNLPSLERRSPDDDPTFGSRTIDNWPMWSSSFGNDGFNHGFGSGGFGGGGFAN